MRKSVEKKMTTPVDLAEPISRLKKSENGIKPPKVEKTTIAITCENRDKLDIIKGMKRFTSLDHVVMWLIGGSDEATKMIEIVTSINKG